MLKMDEEDLGDCCSECGLPVIHVSNSSDVNMGFSVTGKGGKCKTQIIIINNKLLRFGKPNEQ